MELLTGPEWAKALRAAARRNASPVLNLPACLTSDRARYRGASMETFHGTPDVRNSKGSN